MKHFIPGHLPDNARNLLRRLGYGEHIGHGGQTSFSKRLSGADFPRFHVYVEENAQGLQINLHLDQKPVNLGGGSAHGGEYEGTLVEREMNAIISGIKSMEIPEQENDSKSSSRPKKGFWGSFFGT